MKETLCIHPSFLLIHKRKRPAIVTLSSIDMLHKMPEGIFMPQMIIIVNVHAKGGCLIYELPSPGIVVEAIFFALTRDQTTH